MLDDQKYTLRLKSIKLIESLGGTVFWDDPEFDRLRVMHGEHAISAEFAKTGDPYDVDLEYLDVNDQQVIDCLQGLESINNLRLGSTLVSDGIIEHLLRFKSLFHIDLCHTSVTPEGIRKLKELMPELDIHYIMP